MTTPSEDLAPASAANRLGSAERLRIASVLTEAEERGFFGGDRWTANLGFPCELERLPLVSTEAWKDFLKDRRPDVVLGAWKSPPMPSVADGYPHVPYFCYVAGSVRRVIREEHLSAGMLVTNWAASLSRYIAEMALALTLGSLRNLGHYQTSIHHRGGWSEGLAGWPERSLFGKRVGLHGFGAIARELAALLVPFRTQTSVWDPYVDEEVMKRNGVEMAESLEALFASSDVLVECCALTPETKGLLDEALLRRLPAGAVFVNIARGKLVDEEALARLLREGHLRAGLDVFDTEPLSADSPLRGLRNLLMTPHIAADTEESHLAAGDFALANLRRYACGEEVLGGISVEQFRRMT